MVSRRIRRGDVFLVPLRDGTVGVGQVVGSYGKDAFYFAIFDAVLGHDDLDQAAAAVGHSQLVFLALSLDAKLHAGHWTLAGDAPVSSAVPLPAYKEAVGTHSEFDVVDFSGLQRRPATLAEIAALPNRKVVAPVRIEKALLAWHGKEPWLAAFDELLADRVVPSSKVFP